LNQTSEALGYFKRIQEEFSTSPEAGTDRNSNWSFRKPIIMATALSNLSDLIQPKSLREKTIRLP
jgi:hypothetical protein